MPFWIPILIIVGAVILGGVAVSVIIDALKGKRFAVLGAQVTGKTALVNFLSTGTLPKEYASIPYSKKTEANDFKLKDLKLKIEEHIDVPGNPDFYDDWEKIVQDADIVLYLLRTDKLMEGDVPTQKRVEKDMGQIVRWLTGNPKEFPLFIIGTHCDLTTPDLTELPEDKIGDYEDKLRGMPIFQQIALLGGGSRKVRFIFGSLKSTETTELLVYRLIDQVVNHND